MEPVQERKPGLVIVMTEITSVFHDLVSEGLIKLTLALDRSAAVRVIGFELGMPFAVAGGKVIPQEVAQTIGDHSIHYEGQSIESREAMHRQPTRYKSLQHVEICVARITKMLGGHPAEDQIVGCAWHACTRLAYIIDGRLPYARLSQLVFDFIYRAKL